MATAAQRTADVAGNAIRDAVRATAAQMGDARAQVIFFE
jgi:hypothetical protein